MQVETLCCAYYHLRDQLVSQQNTMLQLEATCCEKQTRVLLSATKFRFVARITTEASTCLATNLTSTLVIGCQRSAVTRQIKKNMADAADEEDEFEAVDLRDSRKARNFPYAKTLRHTAVFGTPRMSHQKTNTKTSCKRKKA